jgi:hypothetical protein
MMVTRMGYGHILRYEIGRSCFNEEYGIHRAGRVADAVLFAHKEISVLYLNGGEHIAPRQAPPTSIFVYNMSILCNI